MVFRGVGENRARVLRHLPLALLGCVSLLFLTTVVLLASSGGSTTASSPTDPAEFSENMVPEIFLLVLCLISACTVMTMAILRHSNHYVNMPKYSTTYSQGVNRHFVNNYLVPGSGGLPTTPIPSTEETQKLL